MYFEISRKMNVMCSELFKSNI